VSGRNGELPLGKSVPRGPARNPAQPPPKHPNDRRVDSPGGRWETRQTFAPPGAHPRVRSEREPAAGATVGAVGRTDLLDAVVEADGAAHLRFRALAVADLVDAHVPAEGAGHVGQVHLAAVEGRDRLASDVLVVAVALDGGL